MADEPNEQNEQDELDDLNDLNDLDEQDGANGITLDQLSQMLKLGTTTLKAVRGLTDDEMESAYALAHDYYVTGRYDDAETLFRFLTTYDHLNGRYWMGMGAVHQVKRRYREAIQAYALVISIDDMRNVDASFHAAECFLALGDRVNAASAVAHVRQFADAKTEHGRTVLARANRLSKMIETAKEGPADA